MKMNVPFAMMPEASTVSRSLLFPTSTCSLLTYHVSVKILHTSELICCDNCDKVYHAECLKVDPDTLPDEWHCPCCTGTPLPQNETATLANNATIMQQPRANQVVELMDSSDEEEPKKRTPTTSNRVSKGSKIKPSSLSWQQGEWKWECSKCKRFNPTIRDVCPCRAGADVRDGGKSSRRTGAASSKGNKTSSNQQSNAARGKEEEPLDEKMVRTVIVPEGVVEGDVFYVQLEGKTTIGVVCPEGVYSGHTLVVMLPGMTEAPVSPAQVAKFNERRLTDGIEGQKAVYVLNSFWKCVWPRLKSEGWTCQRQLSFNFGARTFFKPKALLLDRSSRLLNEHYFEAVKEILQFTSKNDQYAEMLVEFDADVMKQECAAKKNAQRKERKNQSAFGNKHEHSRIGSNYQVRSLPKAGTFEPAESEQYM
jgi:hypothetical protein